MRIQFEELACTTDKLQCLSETEELDIETPMQNNNGLERRYSVDPNSQQMFKVHRFDDEMIFRVNTGEDDQQQSDELKENYQNKLNVLLERVAGKVEQKMTAISKTKVELNLEQVYPALKDIKSKNKRVIKMCRNKKLKKNLTFLERQNTKKDNVKLLPCFTTEQSAVHKEGQSKHGWSLHGRSEIIQKINQMKTSSKALDTEQIKIEGKSNVSADIFTILPSYDAAN